MIQRSSIVALVTFAATLSLSAQGPQGVFSGYTVDTRTATLRPVLGIAGAARLGDPVPFSPGVGDAVVHGDRAVVLSTEQPPHAYLLQGLSSGSLATIPLDGSITQPSRVFMNASGTAALLYSTSTATFEFVSSLDATPQFSALIPSGIGGAAFLTAAVSYAGDCALISSADQNIGSVGNLCSDGSLTGIIQQAGLTPAVLAWSHKDRDVLVGDPTGHSILLLRDFVQGGAPVAVASSTDGINTPVGLLAIDANTAAVADSGSASLLIIDLNQVLPVRTIALPEAPSRLDRLGTGNAVVGCNQAGPVPLLLVDLLQNFKPYLVPAN